MAQLLEALQFLDSAAVEALGLRLVAEEQVPTIRAATDAGEAFGHQKIAVLGAGDVEIAAKHGGVERHKGTGGGVHSLVEAGGEHAIFQASGAEQGLLGKRDAF